MGRVVRCSLTDITQIRAKRYRNVHQRDPETIAVTLRAMNVEHPTTTLEELFLSIILDSEARPRRRAAGRLATPPR